MQWGIEFSVPCTDAPQVVNFPDPTQRVRYTTGKGPSPNITFSYLFRYAPQGWREMQRLASIKVQMKQLIPSISFTEENVITNIGSGADIGGSYNINELGKFFPKFIKYPQPWYPQDKDEYMSRLAVYAKKLYRYGLFHFESVMAMAMHFNQLLKSPYNTREVMKKTLSILKLDRSDWTEKLSKDELKAALIKGGKTRGTKVSEEAQHRMMTVFHLLPEYSTDRGSYDVKGLMATTGFSKSTIYNILRKIKDIGLL